MTRTNVSKLSRLERSFVAETQGPPEIPPRVPAAVVGSINHHDLDAHRYPEPPFGGPTVDGESIGHQGRGCPGRSGQRRHVQPGCCDRERLGGHGQGATGGGRQARAGRQARNDGPGPGLRQARQPGEALWGRSSRSRDGGWPRGGPLGESDGDVYLKQCAGQERSAQGSAG